MYTPLEELEPASTGTKLAPRVAIVCRSASEVPWPISIRVTTAAMPMTMPAQVSTERSRWLQLIAGKNLLLLESTQRKAAQLRTELAGPEPSPLEWLLVERIVACWLQVHYSDAAYAQMKGGGPAQHTAALRRQNSAQQRYLQTVKALATVRRLLRPAPAPVEIAARLGGQERVPAGRRDLSPARGVAVEN
jgi:hypothetical protein